MSRKKKNYFSYFISLYNASLFFTGHHFNKFNKNKFKKRLDKLVISCYRNLK